jgi:hypothetical protein
MYKPRTIAFKEVIEVDQWKVKVYTISKQGTFDHSEFYESVLKQIPQWLKLENSFDSSHEHMAFLILHSGTEGIFSIINWWVGKNMLNTHIFLTEASRPSEFKRISGDGLAPCIWELEVIDHERRSWMKQVLKPSDGPDYPSYLTDVINTEI